MVDFPLYVRGRIEQDERLAQECRESGECAGGEALCDEARIRAAFAETMSNLEKEHVVREARTRFHSERRTGYYVGFYK